METCMIGYTHNRRNQRLAQTDTRLAEMLYHSRLGIQVGFALVNFDSNHFIGEKKINHYPTFDVSAQP